MRIWQAVADYRTRRDCGEFLGVARTESVGIAIMVATTPVALYRKGRASARLDNLRNEDVEIYTDLGHPEIGVRGSATVGVSCFDNVAALAGLRGRTWELPANSDSDDTHLLLWRDHPDSDHWNWTPTRDMPGSDFVTALRDVNAKFAVVP